MTDWQPMETAPRDGSTIRFRAGDRSDGHTFWSERPVCMLGEINGGFPPGWASHYLDETDHNLPMEVSDDWEWKPYEPAS